MSPPSASPSAAVPDGPPKSAPKPEFDSDAPKSGAPKSDEPTSNAAAFADGVRAASRSVFVIVLVGGYISMGALAHDLGFSMAWTVASTVLVFAAPAQVILFTALGAGTAPFEAAVAVALSGIRLLPMVVVLLPVLRAAKTRSRALILPAHFTSVSYWMESLRLAPSLPRENRIAFANGIGAGFVSAATIGTIAGFYVAGVLPSALVAALLFLTPMSFLSSAIRVARVLPDRAAYVIGVVLGPFLAWAHVELDLMWTGLVGGTAAYGLHRLYRAQARRRKPS
jgi:predicted branched-subunit amino acid permease